MTGTRTDGVATPSQTVGPFFNFGLAPDEHLGWLQGRGERLRLRIRVVDGDDAPLPDALIEIYQADADGQYGRQSFSGFGRLATREDGTCVFDTIRPGAVSDGRGTQASHINVCVFARGLLRHVYTRVYFTGDPNLDRDPILALVPAGRRATLLASPAAGEPGTWAWVIRLQGGDETVFFDL